MKKLFVLSIMICMLLVGCSNNSDSNDDSGTGADTLENFTEAQLKEESTTVLDHFIAQEYEKVVRRFPEELQAKVTADQLKEAWDTNFPDAGEFKEYKDFVYSEEKANGFIVVTAVYENVNVQYTISFDMDMKLTNFFMK